MTLRFKYIVGLAAVAAGLVSCVKEDFENAANGSYDGIQFNISTVDTKTVYGAQASDKSWPLYWVAGDPIRIYCAEAEDAKQADYTVTPPSANSNTGSMALASGSTALQWGGDSNDHNFYAVYPNTATIENGIATFQINRNQKATVTTTNGYDYDVVAAPDMRNAYMVAKTTTKPTNDAVGLTFKPIMTTLDVVIKADNVNMNETGSARITGISLASTMTSNSTASKDLFYYDITNGAITANGASTSGTSTTMTEQTFVNLVDQSGNASYVDLASGHTLTITVFLPPMSKAAAANMKRQVKVRVHATGNTELVASLKTNDKSSENWTTQLTPGTKRRVVLPALPTDAQYSGNNWITPLDGDIYVSQMSIPGAHDAATGEEMATAIGDWAAVTQLQTMQSLWDLGVRAYDLRPAIYTGVTPNELWIYHGMTRVTISWAEAMNTLMSNLTDNPGEFAIVLFRHEDESTSNKNTSGTDFNTYMTEYVNANKNWIVDWKPDLTIEECRGKIILISRFSGSWSYGCFTGWNHDAAGATTTLKNASGSLSATMYVQDYYESSDYATKWSSIANHLDISKTFHTDKTRTNHWMINHASGYKDVLLFPTAEDYRENAIYQNPKLISYITNDNWEGSTGIVLFDYAGTRSITYTTGIIFKEEVTDIVYGDVALQTIIDNNYKYRMKRKGE